MDQGSIMALAFMVGVAVLGGGLYYAIRWYQGLTWWLLFLMIPIAMTIFVVIDAKNKSGLDGLTAFVLALMLGGPFSIGGLIGGLVAGWRKTRQDG